MERVTISTLWTDSANYKARWKVLLTNVLPKVDSVKVIKTPDWERTHKVRLRLILRNPYPEDLVGENDRMSVMEERKRQGFNSRMFAWDEKARIIIRRFSKEDEHYNGVDEVAETIIVEGGDVKSDPLTGNWFVEVFDTQTAPDTHYYYQAVVDNSKSDYPICTNMTEPTVSSEADANSCYTNTIGSISDFKASQGEFVGLVGLSWESDNTGTFSLTKQRYKLGYDPVNSVKADDQTSEDDKDDDATDDGGQQSVIRIDGHKATDSHSLAGQVDEYILTKTITRRGKVYADTVRTLGYSVYKAGRISGYVRMADGMAFPGKVEVRVRLTSPERLLLRNIYARDGETLVMPGYTFDTEDITVTAGDDGYYEVDSLCYYGSGVQYTVTASSGNASFYNTTGESGGIALTLEDANHEYTNVDFVCRDTQRISGRIVYAGSTVPVRDMEFYVNDRKLVDTEGKAIVTDAAGEFSFAVPKLEMSIQARKNGHVLSGEGYILGGANASERVFTPTQDYDVTMTDSTTIRLMGRVAGGDAEGGKPLGFGESSNILGDSITLVLQLEGDNTSFIHYNMDNPDEKSVSRTFTQDVYLQNGGVRHTGMTNATFESKRIVIKADNETGEFSLDLFPAKYKLSQFYANGYGTLYLSGEGIHIIDLTDSTTNNRYENGKMQTEYCASFNKTYHAPAQLTVRQTEGGSALDYYGVEKLMVSTVAGLQDMETAWRQDGKVRYVFGHPVFRGGDTYTFLAEAFEEYRYNNSATGSRVRVPVGGRRLTVTNGFDNSHPVVSGLLNASGKMEFSVTPANANFSAVGENALLTLGAAVDIEGYSYQAEPVRAFVTGDRDMGVDVQAAVECTPQILDYIRDPYGANSYAYREKGTQYNWTSHYENDYKEYFQFSLSKTKGGLAPLSSDDLRISVDRNMAPGSYSTFIYITDEDGLVSKLNFNLVVDVTFPYDEFPLDSTYSETMNIIAAVKKKSSSGNWVIDMNPKDIVAAFVDNKCLSLTPVSVDAIRNTAHAFMTIAGNSNIQDRVIEFYLWNAADGQIYVLEPGTETLTESGTKWEPYYIRYCNRQVIGADRPVVLRTTKQKAQWIDLAKGWNWVSFNVRVPASNRLNNIFSGISEFTTGDIIQQMGTNFASYQSDRTWDDGMADVTLTKNDVFQIYSHYGGLITVLGAEFETHERVAELVFRNGSSWASLPYLLDVSQPINSALSDFVPGGPKAPAGTVIKSHDQFAVATDDGQWLGSLKYLIPGEGYYVKRNGLTDTVSISFTNTFVGKTPERPTRSLLADATPEEYVSSMPIVADWMDGEYREGDLLLAIANGRVVGVAEKTDGRFFLTVNADEGTEIRFAKMRDGQVVAATRKGIRYTATGVLGTLQSPYLIDFSDTDAKSVYDITGIKYGDIESINARRGVFIIDGRKVLRK